MRKNKKAMNRKEWIITLALICAALVLCFPVASILSSPEAYTSTYESLDEKMENVLGLTAACTITSSAISAVPDDIGSAVAMQLAEYTDWLLLIFSVLLTEKYLLTILGMITFRIVLPLVLIFQIPAIRGRLGLVGVISHRLGAVCLALFLVIPTSMLASNLITETHGVSFEETVDAAELFAGLTEVESTAEVESGGITGWLNKIESTVSGAANVVMDLPEKVSDLMNQFIQSIAVMLVTSCVIPLLVLAAFLWIVKIITGQEVKLQPPRKRREKLERENTENSLPEPVEAE